jgi:hypothetical protein
MRLNKHLIRKTVTVTPKGSVVNTNLACVRLWV